MKPVKVIDAYQHLHDSINQALQENSETLEVLRFLCVMLWTHVYYGNNQEAEKFYDSIKTFCLNENSMERTVKRINNAIELFKGTLHEYQVYVKADVRSVESVLLTCHVSQGAEDILVLTNYEYKGETELPPELWTSS